MVVPLVAAHCDAVVAGQPFLPAGFQQLFPLLTEKVLQIHSIGPLFLFVCKINIS